MMTESGNMKLISQAHWLILGRLKTKAMKFKYELPNK